MEIFFPSFLTYIHHEHMNYNDETKEKWMCDHTIQDENRKQERETVMYIIESMDELELMVSLYNITTQRIQCTHCSIHTARVSYIVSSLFPMIDFKHKMATKT